MRGNSSNPLFGLKVGSDKYYLQATSSGLFLGPTSTVATSWDANGNVTMRGTNRPKWGTSNIALTSDIPSNIVTTTGQQALTNKTYNGYTLAAACAKAIASSISSSDTGLVTAQQVYNNCNLKTEMWNVIDGYCISWYKDQNDDVYCECSDAWDGDGIGVYSGAYGQGTYGVVIYANGETYGFGANSQSDYVIATKDIAFEYYQGGTYGECYSKTSPGGEYSMQIGESGFTVDTGIPGEQGNENLLVVSSTGMTFCGDTVATLPDIPSNTTKYNSSDTTKAQNIRILTQAQYNALATKDSNTIYLITT